MGIRCFVEYDYICDGCDEYEKQRIERPIGCDFPLHTLPDGWWKYDGIGILCSNCSAIYKPFLKSMRDFFAARKRG